MKGAEASGARLWPRLSFLLRPSDFARTFGTALNHYSIAHSSRGLSARPLTIDTYPIAHSSRGLSARPLTIDTYPIARSSRGLSARPLTLIPLPILRVDFRRGKCFYIAAWAFQKYPLAYGVGFLIYYTPFS